MVMPPHDVYAAAAIAYVYFSSAIHMIDYALMAMPCRATLLLPRQLTLCRLFRRCHAAMLPITIRRYAFREALRH